MTGLGYYEAGICSGCGFHHSLTEDRRNVFQIEDTFCNVCAGASKYARVQQSQDSDAETRLGQNPPPAAPRPSDGRHTVLRRVPRAQVAPAKNTQP